MPTDEEDESDATVTSAKADPSLAPALRSCPACARPNRPSAKFCAKCGTALGAPCGNCGTPAGADDTFCVECGLPLGGPALGLPLESSPDPVHDVAGREIHEMTVSPPPHRPRNSVKAP